MHAGNFVLLLHAHLPYVLGHGTWPHGSDWLCEAVAESYIPLLNLCYELLEEDILANITIDLSPVLCEQLSDERFSDLFATYCLQFAEAAREDARYFEQKVEEKHFAPIARFWAEWYEQRLQDFQERYKGSILGALRQLQEQGAIEILTCAATHPYLPLLALDESIEFQLQTAKANYVRHFQIEPRGIWLPECGYRPSYAWMPFFPIPEYPEPQVRPGLEQFLAQHHLDFFFVDQHITEKAVPLGVLRPVDHRVELLSVHSPEYIHFPYNFDRSPLNLYHVCSTGDIQRGTAVVFTRHRDIALQVWSGEMGYPGDPDYLDFHKRHYRSNLRYWRVTDPKLDMMYKQPYVPENATRKTDLHAYHFNQMLEHTARFYHTQTKKFATLCTMFDAELFGHWWFEGPQFLKNVLRGLFHSPYVRVTKASEQVDYVQPHEVMAIPEGSWGDGGDHRVWFNEQTHWMWYAIYQAEHQFHQIMQVMKTSDQLPLLERILQQAGRELLLLQASDWEFLVTTQSAKDYAEQRFFTHHSNFLRLMTMAQEYRETRQIAEFHLEFLTALERLNRVFPDLSLQWWSLENHSMNDEESSSAKAFDQDKSVDR